MCCGGEPRRRIYTKEEDIYANLRSINDPSLINDDNKKEYEIKMDLEKYVCEFDSETGTWATEFKNKYEEIENEKKIKEEIKIRKKKLYENEVRCEELEKEFLAKTIRLLYMAQTHCDYKYENDELFEKYGIKTGNKKLDLDKILPKANTGTIISENKKEPESNIIVSQQVYA